MCLTRRRIGLAGVHLYKGPTVPLQIRVWLAANLPMCTVCSDEWPLASENKGTWEPRVSAVCFLLPCDIIHESCPVDNPWLQQSRLGHSGGQPWLDSVLWKLVNVFKKDRAINHSRWVLIALSNIRENWVFIKGIRILVNREGRSRTQFCIYLENPVSSLQMGGDNMCTGRIYPTSNLHLLLIPFPYSGLPLW